VKLVAETPKVSLRKNLAGLQERFDEVIPAAANMAASMIKKMGDADISAAGNFGSRWTSGLHVFAEKSGRNRMQITVTEDVPYADIFETGGEIEGNPFLWIPISGTDAEGVRARDYGALFSIKGTSQNGHPLLFSVSDKKPKYFGIASVVIPKTFHLDTIIQSVMANFRAYFDQAWRG
jgi:hypothetical protein